MEVLVVGDSKMGALATRGHIVAGQSCYLCAYHPPRPRRSQNWRGQALARAAMWQCLEKVDRRRAKSSRLDRAGAASWAGPQALSEPRAGAHGRRTHRAGWVAGGWCKRAVADETLPDGTRRWIVSAGGCIWPRQALVDRLGWQVYITNTTKAHYSAPALVASRASKRLRSGLQSLKPRNLHIRPVYLRNETRIASCSATLPILRRVSSPSTSSAAPLQPWLRVPAERGTA